jgi:hypothetical protein
MKAGEEIQELSCHGRATQRLIFARNSALALSVRRDSGSNPGRNQWKARTPGSPQTMVQPSLLGRMATSDGGTALAASLTNVAHVAAFRTNDEVPAPV